MLNLHALDVSSMAHLAIAQICERALHMVPCEERKECGFPLPLLSEYVQSVVLGANLGISSIVVAERFLARLHERTEATWSSRKCVCLIVAALVVANKFVGKPWPRSFPLCTALFSR